MSETQNLKTRNKELEKVLPAVKTKQKKKPAAGKIRPLTVLVAILGFSKES